MGPYLRPTSLCHPSVDTPFVFNHTCHLYITNQWDLNPESLKSGTGGRKSTPTSPPGGSLGSSYCLYVKMAAPSEVTRTCEAPWWLAAVLL